MFVRLWPWGKKIEIPLSLFSAHFYFFSHITLDSSTSNGISENQSFQKRDYHLRYMNKWKWEKSGM